MNVKRFTARTSRDALALVRHAFGDDAVVMSTRPCAEGVEVLAMAPESVLQLEHVGMPAEPRQPLLQQQLPKPQYNIVQPRDARETRDTRDARDARDARPAERLEPSFDSAVEQDIEQLQMSTLSFQDYVRQRMLKRREAQRLAEAAAEPAAAPPVLAPIAAARSRAAQRELREPRGADDMPVLGQTQHDNEPSLGLSAPAAAQQPASASTAASASAAVSAAATTTATAAAAATAAATAAASATAATRAAEQTEMMGELRSMRGLIEQRFGALAFMDKLQRQPRQAQLAQRLLDTGFSPALIRKLVDSLPADVDEMTWAAGVLERNLATAERETALEDAGGVYALIGATGVGKTTSTAKLAAAFAARHGAAELGLITLDAYRVAAHEQLRTYGRILGVPVHTAHDRASLEDLLDLLSAKRMVLIDTAGMAQRDTRTRELLDMVSHRSVNRILVVNASAQGETIEDQLAAYGAPGCRGLILSKLDEAVKLGPALDSMIRHKLKVLAVANGQRVPEDWHRLSANALIQRALKSQGGAAWKLDDHDVNLIFAGLPARRGNAQMGAAAVVGAGTAAGAGATAPAARV